MIARPSSSYRPRQHSTTSLPNSNLVQSTSRPGTPPRSRGESHLHKSSSKSRHIPLQVMSDRPIIPKSKKPDGRRRDGASPSAQRSRIRQDAAALTMEQEQIDDDEEMLYDLLGVTSPLPPRVQPSSKDNSLPVSTFPLDISRPRIRNRIGKYAADSEPERRGKGTRGRRDVSRREAESDSRAPVAQARSAKLRVNRDPGEHGIMSEGDAIHHSRSQRQKALSRDPSSDGHVSPSAQTIPNPLSGINATRTKMRRHSPVSAGTPPIDSESVFDLSPLIQSLPDAGPLPLIPQPVAGSRSARKFPKSGDESAVWDMPDTISSLNKQELTWQQKLQDSSSQSPRHNLKSTPSERRPITRSIAQLLPPHKPTLDSRPAYPRRLSLDAEPYPRVNPPFHEITPYHILLDASRSPQTPAKIPTFRPPGADPLTAEFSEVPRSKGPTAALMIEAGPKYAGPTFHNSPHAASLPKPDLNDF